MGIKVQMIISSVKNNSDSLIVIDVAEEISSGLKNKSEMYNQNLYFVLLINKLRCLVYGPQNILLQFAEGATK